MIFQVILLHCPLRHQTDNFSTDDTSEVLALFTDKRIKVFQNQNNGSIAKSRNFAVNNSRGEWIAFLDSDDWWHINKIQTCSKYFTNSYDLIYHNMNIFLQTSQINHTKGILSRQVKRPVIYNLIIRGNPIACSSVIVRKAPTIKLMELIKQVIWQVLRITTLGLKSHFILTVSKELKKISEHIEGMMKILFERASLTYYLMKVLLKSFSLYCQ